MMTIEEAHSILKNCHVCFSELLKTKHDAEFEETFEKVIDAHSTIEMDELRKYTPIDYESIAKILKERYLKV